MIVREDRDDIAILRIEHGKVNALDLDLLEAMIAEIGALRRQPPRGVVVTGTGGNFSAGLDLVRLLDGGDSYIERLLPALHTALIELFTLPRPVIAAVNGHAIAGGFIIACACDYRIAVVGPARMGFAEHRVGVPFPSAPVELVRDVVGTRQTRGLFYSGRLISVHEALELGFLDEVVDSQELLERAVEVALRWSATPAAAFELTKRQIQEPTLDRLRRHHESFEGEIARVWNDPEVRASIREFVDKTLRR